jgi:uncharacterized protein (TIGR02646 family)
VRYIRLTTPPPSQDWIDKANGLLEQLKGVPDTAERNAIIDRNASVWGELKPWLLSISHGKCWFSEAKDCFNHWDVEHYRPKKLAKDIDGAEQDGYWWLAFDWKNLRICGSVGNRKKGTYFPLRPATRRADGPDFDLRFEHPLLLDPTDPDDPTLLSFSMEGRAIPAPDVTGWDKQRVEYSVEKFNLNFPPLMDRRKLYWAECWQLIQEYRSELQKQTCSHNEVAREGMRRAAKAIRTMMHDDKELSSVVRACVLSAGDQRLNRLLQSL